jgi:hypothetical protein
MAVIRVTVRLGSALIGIVVRASLRNKAIGATTVIALAVVVAVWHPGTKEGHEPTRGTRTEACAVQKRDPVIEEVSVPSAHDEFAIKTAEGYEYKVSYDLRPKAFVDSRQGAPGTVELDLDYCASTFRVENITKGKKAPGLTAMMTPMYRTNNEKSSAGWILSSPVKFGDGRYARTVESRENLASLVGYVRDQSDQFSGSNLNTMAGAANWLSQGTGRSDIELDVGAAEQFGFSSPNPQVVPEGLVGSLCEEVIWVVSVRIVWNRRDSDMQTFPGKELLLDPDASVFGSESSTLAGKNVLVNNPVSAMN